MELITEVSVIASMGLGVFKLYQAVTEYKRGQEEKRLQGAQQRADFFLKRQQELFCNSSFAMMRSLLENDDPSLVKYSFEEKRAFLTFFEGIALSMNSGLISEDVAYYMFGYYTVMCEQSKNFWQGDEGVNKTSLHWGVFLAFAEKMERRFNGKQTIPFNELKF
ncbi:MAG: hypothetical protein HY849_09885 [Nitrosomonadales bacterium]|nr:hypothetical protein [Nitrosomonadales bacterium]